MQTYTSKKYQWLGWCKRNWGFYSCFEPFKPLLHLHQPNNMLSRDHDCQETGWPGRTGWPILEKLPHLRTWGETQLDHPAGKLCLHRSNYGRSEQRAKALIIRVPIFPYILFIHIKRRPSLSNFPIFPHTQHIFHIMAIYNDKTNQNHISFPPYFSEINSSIYLEILDLKNIRPVFWNGQIVEAVIKICFVSQLVMSDCRFILPLRLFLFCFSFT